jgi:hypothetical protein
VAVIERMRGPVFGEARTREGFAPDILYERVRTGTWPGQDVAA